MIQIQWTCADPDEARRLCRALVEKRLVACANLIPSIESIYIWDDALQSSTETKVYLKASSKNFSRIEEYIVSHSSYDVPEILAFSITEGHQPYLDWMKQE